MRPSPKRTVLSVAGLVVLLAAAAGLVGARSFFTTSNEPVEVTAAPVVPVDPNTVYDPVLAGEELPEGYLPLVRRDQIEPVYDPVFTSAGEVNWPSESLVIGVSAAETAKAYPVTHLNSREMVIDSLEGIPILVTW